MFTGIIQRVAKVLDFRKGSAGAKVTIDLGPMAQNVKFGESVAVNGACLTVIAIDGANVTFDIMAETLKVTTLGFIKAGDLANLEPAMQIGAKLEGHIVQGHVDGIAEVTNIKSAGEWTIEMTAPAVLLEQMVNKGSVAVNGVSLTLVNVTSSRFSVSLIPTSLEETNLKFLSAGDKVNIETDILGKYVLSYLKNLTNQGAKSSSRLTMDTLRESGFM